MNKTNISLLRKRILCLILLISAGFFVYISPKLFKDGLSSDQYREWFLPEKEPETVIVEIWHIAGFKPYTGSLSRWLENKAADFANGYVGVYFNVKAYSPMEAEEQLMRGSRPDIISFPDGAIYNVSYARPYCSTGDLVVYDPSAAIVKDLDELIQNAAPVEQFKKGKASSCICDIRGAGDLYRAELIGKCPYFEAEPIEGSLKKQLIGVYNGIDQNKIPYAESYIEYVLSVKSQSTICMLGLIPAERSAKAEYEQDWLKKLYESSLAASSPPPY